MIPGSTTTYTTMVVSLIIILVGFCYWDIKRDPIVYQRGCLLSFFQMKIQRGDDSHSYFILTCLCFCAFNPLYHITLHTTVFFFCQKLSEISDHQDVPSSVHIEMILYDVEVYITCCAHAQFKSSTDLLCMDKLNQKILISRKNISIRRNLLFIRIQP